MHELHFFILLPLFFLSALTNLCQFCDKGNITLLLVFFLYHNTYFVAEIWASYFNHSSTAFQIPVQYDYRLTSAWISRAHSWMILLRFLELYQEYMVRRFLVLIPDGTSWQTFELVRVDFPIYAEDWRIWHCDKLIYVCSFSTILFIMCYAWVCESILVCVQVFIAT